MSGLLVLDIQVDQPDGGIDHLAGEGNPIVIPWQPVGSSLLPEQSRLDIPDMRTFITIKHTLWVEGSRGLG